MYWVKSAKILPGDNPLQLEAKPEEAPSFLWVLATNLKENLMGRSMLRAGQYCQVYRGVDQGGNVRWYIDTLDRDARFFVSGEQSAVHCDDVSGLAVLECDKFYKLYQFHRSRRPIFFDGRRGFWFNGELYFIGAFVRPSLADPDVNENGRVYKWDQTQESGEGDWVLSLPEGKLDFAYDCCIFQDRLCVVGNPGGTTNAGAVWSTADGVTWTNDAPIDGSNDIDGTAYACIVYNGKLIVGGDFNGFTARSRALMQYDGSTWTSMGTGLGLHGGNPTASGEVHGFCLHDDGSAAGERLVIVGAFLVIDGTTVAAGAVVYWNGSTFTLIGGGISVGSGFISCCISWHDGEKQLLVVGSSGGGSLQSFDGTIWGNMGPAVTRSPSYGTGPVFAAISQIGADLLVSGSFTDEVTLDGLGDLIRVGTWPGSGSFAGYGAGFDDGIYALIEHGGIKCAGGKFKHSGTKDIFYFARFINGLWRMDYEFTAPVRVLIEAFSKLIALGDMLKGYWSDDGGTTFNDFTTFNDKVYCAVVRSGVLWIGGEYTHGGGLVAAGLVSWAGSGAFDIRIIELERGDSEPGIIYDMGFDGTKLYIVGDFSFIRGTVGPGVAAANVAVLDLNTNETSALGSGLSGPGHSVAVYDGYVWVGYDSTLAGGSSRPYFAKWNISGAAWATSGITTSAPCYSVRVVNYGSGDVLAVGHYGHITGSANKYELVYYNGSAWAKAATTNGDLDADIRCINGTGSAIDFGGDFEKAGEIVGTLNKSMMLIGRMTTQRRWRRVAGGLGNQVEQQSIGISPGNCNGLNLSKRDGCTHVICTGDFGRCANVYSEFISYATASGFHPMQLGLTFASAVTFHLSKAFKRGNDWIIYGNHTGARNEHILPQDSENVQTVVNSPGILRWDGRYFYPLGVGVDRAVGFACEFDGTLMAFGDFKPMIYDSDDDVWLYDEVADGTLFDSWGPTMAGVIFNHKIYLCGHGFDGDHRLALIWNGSTSSPVVNNPVIPDASNGIAEDIKVATISGTERMFLAVTATGGKSAVREWNGSAFVELATSGTKLQETVIRLAIGEVPGESWIMVALGAMTLGGGDFVLAYYRFSTQVWTSIGTGVDLSQATCVTYSPRDKCFLIGMDGALIETIGEKHYNVSVLTWTPPAGFGMLWERGVNAIPRYIGIERDGVIGGP